MVPGKRNPRTWTRLSMEVDQRLPAMLVHSVEPCGSSNAHFRQPLIGAGEDREGKAGEAAAAGQKCGDADKRIKGAVRIRVHATISGRRRAGARNERRLDDAARPTCRKMSFVCESLGCAGRLDQHGEGWG